MQKAVSPIRVTLREARTAAGLTQVELAAKADVRQATISDIEKSKTTRIDLPVLERLCQALGVTDIGRLLVYEPLRARGRKR